MNQTKPHVFIGYPDAIKGYICFNPTSGKTRMSRDVTFVEEDFTQNSDLLALSDESEGDEIRVNNRLPDSLPIGIIKN